MAAAAISIGLRASGARQALRHYDFRAAGSSLDHIKFVHEGAHQKNSAAGSAQKVFLGERVGNIGQLEAGAFIGYVDDHFFRGEIDGEVNFLFGLFFVAIMKGVDHALANAHADAVTLVFAETCRFRETQTHLFRQVHAFHLRFQCDLKVLGFWRHPALYWAKCLNFAAL